MTEQEMREYAAELIGPTIRTTKGAAMRTRYAADLKSGDTVVIAADDRRVVESVEFTTTPIAPGQFAVSVRWVGRERANLLRPDQEMRLEG